MKKIRTMVKYEENEDSGEDEEYEASIEDYDKG